MHLAAGTQGLPRGLGGLPAAYLWAEGSRCSHHVGESGMQDSGEGKAQGLSLGLQGPVRAFGSLRI